jgi:hypothetical protein
VGKKKKRARLFGRAGPAAAAGWLRHVSFLSFPCPRCDSFLRGALFLFLARIEVWVALTSSSMIYLGGLPRHRHPLFFLFLSLFSSSNSKLILLVVLSLE